MVSYEEKGTWVYLVTSAGAYAVYLAIILGRVAGTPVADVSYAAVLLWTAGASIVASIIGRTLVETVSPSDSRRGDVRDRDVSRFGEYASRWFLVAGAAAALVLFGAFTSIPDAAAYRYPYLPVRVAVGVQFNSLARIGDVHMPVVITHSRDDKLIPYVLEVNPRASRTVPYISKVTGIPMVDLATRCMMGQKLTDLHIEKINEIVKKKEAEVLEV